MTDQKTAQTGAILKDKPSPTHRILVVDDEPDILRLNVETLEDSGYHADAANDGAVAWDTLQVESYHLLITDNDMPKVSGVDLLKKLHEADMKLPVIMATATWPGHVFERNPWLQPTAKLLKPYTIEELLVTVKMVLCPTNDVPKQA